MNYSVTQELLDAIASFVSKDAVDISTENRDWRGNAYKSDLVTLDAKNNIGFEVLDNEIILFFFSDHHHFEDYSCELGEGEPNYVERAKVFLADLFRCRIRKVRNYRGKTLTSEKYIFIYPDGTEECPAGTLIHSILIGLVPFLKKRTESQTWCYDQAKGMFTNRQPKNPDPDAIECIDVSEDCYIEIFEKRGVYTYGIMEIDFDDYYGMYYWVPAVNVLPSGMYDTKEKAIDAAWNALRCCNNPQNFI